MNESEVICRVWRVEQEILDVFHEICVENKLKYTLAYGTLLGAVRHKGFIPWDDDIDVMMPRDDYEKLLVLWKKKAPEEYILLDYHDIEDYTNNFAKIRKDHTTFIQDECELGKTYHKGIFIDIFPCDRVATGKFGKKIQFLACAINLLYTRGYKSSTGGLIGRIEGRLLKTKKQNYKHRREKAEKIIKKWNNKTENEFIAPCTIECCKKYYPADMFENLTLIKFNENTYMAVRDADTILRIEYGDYMRMPPENERVWKHHPRMIDFEHNYEEL
ncbi:LicD family protein [Blautia obeum]|uniref:LicD family protein n=1 Tax=Blautia obeum TaxID=40520 RepID=UPI003F89B7DB